MTASTAKDMKPRALVCPHHQSTPLAYRVNDGSNLNESDSDVRLDEWSEPHSLNDTLTSLSFMPPSLSWDDADDADYHNETGDAHTLVSIDRDDANTGDKADG